MDKSQPRIHWSQLSVEQIEAFLNEAIANKDLELATHWRYILYLKMLNQPSCQSVTSSKQIIIESRFVGHKFALAQQSSNLWFQPMAAQHRFHTNIKSDNGLDVPSDSNTYKSNTPDLTQPGAVKFAGNVTVKR
ncbi:MAG: hypothetical protein EZS28_039894 [Streblomastix strix]|uniref:Uncharacterized protein n=1 Tax=Streblomastix strix TaxID=222440 RepID=A0A5J4U2Q9_9EUKA|nr:MAG: hypothetical protein EZS28_039894 [Streblomastix strix]